MAPRPSKPAGRFTPARIALLLGAAGLAGLLAWPVERRVTGPVVLEIAKKAGMRLEAPADGRVRELYIEAGGTAVPGKPAAYFEPADAYLTLPDAAIYKPTFSAEVQEKLSPLRGRVFEGAAALQTALGERLNPTELSSLGPSLLRAAVGPRGNRLPLDTPPQRLARETLESHIGRLRGLIADIDGLAGRLNGRDPSESRPSGIARPLLAAVLPAARDAALDARRRLEAERDRRVLRIPYPPPATVHGDPVGSPDGDWTVIGPDPERLVGALTRSGAALADFGESARLVAVVTVPAGRVGQVREGQRVEMSLTRFPGELREAAVAAVPAKADEFGAFRVTAEVTRTRFAIDATALAALARDELPAEAVEKLADLAGRKFDGPHTFREALAGKLSTAELSAWWPAISRQARAAAARALPDSPPLQPDMEGRADIIVGRQTLLGRLLE